ncbi:hypothetical protein SteCoe_12394 [Stentor coeruleus]|uniref:Uncharacterized protein n=1 Tax=Stentor coeruleus TaxID=5963 RepID=A0A1R2CAU2_9CILI|nr:hypothetical protein SteCoe_12394 [Stentor coeruleus]
MVLSYLKPINIREAMKYTVLYNVGKSNSQFSPEHTNHIKKLVIKNYFVKSAGMAASICGAYFVPLPINEVFVIPTRILLGLFTFRVLTTSNQIALMNQIKEYCIQYEIEKKIDTLTMSEKDKNMWERSKLYEKLHQNK